MGRDWTKQFLRFFSALTFYVNAGKFGVLVGKTVVLNAIPHGNLQDCGYIALYYNKDLWNAIIIIHKLILNREIVLHYQAQHRPMNSKHPSLHTQTHREYKNKPKTKQNPKG